MADVFNLKEARQSSSKNINLGKEISESLAFDDVLLLPNYSEILPHEADLSTKVSRNIKINIPFVSAAMDTVTDAGLAIEIANLGGVGIIHRNWSLEKQISEIKKVKRFESCFINNPTTLSPENTVKDAIELVNTRSFSGFPVVLKGKLVGIVTKRDLRTIADQATCIKEVMSKNVITGKIGISTEEARQLMLKHKVEKLPLVDKQGRLASLVTLKDIMSQQLKPLASKDSTGRLLVGSAVGVTDIERALESEAAGADFVAIDSAHGYTKKVIATLKELRKKIKIDIICGNIVEETAAKDLIEAGADSVKVGIGPGSICTTRVISGVGVPQFTAILNVSHYANKKSIPVIADGGIRYSGDITKALAAGASCVMIGSLFAGCDEAPGEKIIYKGRAYKTYRGMGSLGAIGNYTKDRYGMSGKSVPEGIEGMVAVKGALKDIAFQLEGGVRAGMGYCGAKNITDLWEKARFTRVTNAGLKESHPHDILITREAPNYFIDSDDSEQRST